MQAGNPVGGPDTRAGGRSTRVGAWTRVDGRDAVRRPGNAVRRLGACGRVSREMGNALENAGRVGCERRERRLPVTASPAIWVAEGGLSSHTGISHRQLTGGMFGVTNPTCDDSSEVHCDRNAAVGKMSSTD